MAGLLTCGSIRFRSFPAGIISPCQWFTRSAHRLQLRGQSRSWQGCNSLAAPRSLFILDTRTCIAETISPTAIADRYESSITNCAIGTARPIPARRYQYRENSMDRITHATAAKGGGQGWTAEQAARWRRQLGRHSCGWPQPGSGAAVHPVFGQAGELCHALLEAGVDLGPRQFERLQQQPPRQGFGLHIDLHRKAGAARRERQ